MHLFHNAPFCNRNVHMCAHFCYKMVLCGISVKCISEMRFLRWVYQYILMPYLSIVKSSTGTSQWWEGARIVPGEGAHYMKVITYALPTTTPTHPPFLRFLESLYSFDPYIWAKMQKISYFKLHFLSKIGEMYILTSPFLYFVAFWVNGRFWASLSITQPCTTTPWSL